MPWTESDSVAYERQQLVDTTRSQEAANRRQRSILANEAQCGLEYLQKWIESLEQRVVALEAEKKAAQDSEVEPCTNEIEKESGS